MANYYCLIAGLPDIELADTQPGMPMEDFIEQMNDTLDYWDAKMMANYFFLLRDCQNLITFLKDPEAELKYEGAMNKEQFTDLVKSATEMNFNVHRYPQFMSIFAREWAFNKDKKGYYPEDEILYLFYEYAIKTILSGGMQKEKGSATALNYWLGMDSGVIGVEYSPRLPAGVRQLAQILEDGLRNGTLDPFRRKIIAQDGSVKNDGTKKFTPEQLLRMDWLCENVIGTIPPFEDILPISQTMVRELGLYRDAIPTEKERRLHEDFDHLR